MPKSTAFSNRISSVYALVARPAVGAGDARATAPSAKSASAPSSAAMSAIRFPMPQAYAARRGKSNARREAVYGVGSRFRGQGAALGTKGRRDGIPAYAE